MEWLFSTAGGGHAMFDQYSLVHIIWFMALTTLFAPVFKKNIWMAMLALGFSWEVSEFWIVNNISNFPFTAGHESFWNKCVGDPISNILGFLIAWYCIKSFSKGEKDGIRQ